MMGMHSAELLFNKADLFSVIDHQTRGMQAEIERLDRNRILNANVDDLVAYFSDKYSINVPVLHEDRMHADQGEAQIDISHDPYRDIRDRSRPTLITGTRVTVTVPYTGDEAMFGVQPSTYTSGPPRAQVTSNAVLFHTEGTNLSGEQIKAALDDWLKNIKQYLQWQTDGVAGFNNTLAAKARDAIEKRRSKLLADQNLVASLGIALKRTDAPATYTAPEVRRKLAPTMPVVTSAPFKPEPTLEMAEYEHILEIIGNMSTVLERSPKAFHDIDEEALRMHFLVQLNARYQGNATGETFNYQGKTDILVRSGDRNIFIAECKFWGGVAVLTKTVDQLLSYLAWRDSKAAILLFNRNKDMTKVLESIPHTIKHHPLFRKELPRPSQTSFRYVFRHKDDPAKDIIVTVLVFDVPKSVAEADD